LAVSAEATVLTSDNFPYPDGSLDANAGWTTHSGTIGSLQVLGGQAVLQENGSASGDAHKTFAATPGNLYYGVDFSVDDLGTPYVGADNEYFAHLMGAGTFNFRAKIDIVAATGAGDFSVGLATRNSSADVVWATDLTYGTTYRAIVKYDQTINQAQLWINAVLPTDTSVLGIDEIPAAPTMDAFGLRESFSSMGEVVRVDNMAVATTFAEVVPEPTTLALLAIGGLALIRRRR